MKVAILGSLPPLRGLSSYCFELVQALAKFTEIDFISFSSMYPGWIYPGGNLKEDHTFPELNRENLRIRRRLAWYNPLSWLFEALRTEGDLLHVQWWSLPLVPVYAVTIMGFKLRRKPVVLTIHNVESHEESKIYKLFCRILFRFGDHFIVHSASNRDFLVREYRLSDTKVSRIPHGPLDFHVRCERSRAELLAEFKLQPENKILLVYGAIRPYKGIDTALRAFREVVKVLPECRMLIAGKLWESWARYDALMQSLDIEGKVLTRLEYIPSAEVYKYFTLADLVLLPYTHFEAQSGVGATALSFSKPMIVTDVGGLPELVMDRRYVVPPKDASALAEKVVDCLRNPSELAKMSEQAASVADAISWPAIAEKTWSIYNSLIHDDEIPVL